jgi:hypothetical protein
VTSLFGPGFRKKWLATVLAWRPILFIADFFHPVNGLAIQLFLDGDVGHARARCGAMPVLLVGREPDHVTGTNFLDGAAFALGPPAACRHDEILAEGVSVPCGAGAGFECHTDTLNARWVGCLKQVGEPNR